MDFEMMSYPQGHYTSPVLPPALALGEWLHLSGTALITALVLGFEVQARVTLAYSKLPVHRALHHPGIVGPLGSAATCAKLLNLDLQKTRWALGIAASRAGSLVANSGTMTKSTHPGNAARMGLEAALMAGEGWTANENIIESTGGFAEALFPPGSFELDLVIKDFGKPYRMVSPGINIKVYPSQYTTPWAITATLDLQRQHHFDPKAIEKVEVVTQDSPAARNLFPQSGLAGKFSIPYVVSAALLDEKVVIDSFTDTRRFAPDMEEMLGKVHITLDPSHPTDLMKDWAQVTVILRDGTSYTARCNKPPGHLMRPLSLEEHQAKFYDCAKRVLNKSDSDLVIEMVQNLEGLQDVTNLVSILTNP